MAAAGEYGFTKEFLVAAGDGSCAGLFLAIARERPACCDLVLKASCSMNKHD